MSKLQSKAARRQRTQNKASGSGVSNKLEVNEGNFQGSQINHGMEKSGKKSSKGILNSKKTNLLDDQDSEEIELDTLTVVQNEQNEIVEETDEVEQKQDDGYIELVLRVLARMCDGQHKGLQDYLREQPDNMKSFNIVAETTQFVNLVYSNMNSSNIDLAIQLFDTLNEFTVGNQANRSVLLNSKVIDYVNFILRAADLKTCDPLKVLCLQSAIGNLTHAMIEENGEDALVVAKEVKDTLDKEAVYRIMSSCYEATNSNDVQKTASVLGFASVRNLSSKVLNTKSKLVSPEMKEKYDEVGFTYFLILTRICDIDPKFNIDTLTKKANQNKLFPIQQGEEENLPKDVSKISNLPGGESFAHYKKNTMSIEILKEDELQKINFRVKNKAVLREEVKEKMIWSVDRSSPSNKIRDFMKWSSDILKDVEYQRKLLASRVAKFFTNNWLFWNKMVIFLSVAINTLMLITWTAKAGVKDFPENTTEVPPEIYDPIPKITLKEYDIIIYSLGGTHNFFTLLVLVTYFLSNHPSLPKFQSLKKVFSKKKREEEETLKKNSGISKLEIDLFSFTTLYYVIMLGASVAGTVFQGYFFAFHLLNIVNNNQLLKGVIQAVTQNGKSLLWVAVLGFIVFYLYALVSFALLRASFTPSERRYCDTLWQCTVTVIRYGLVGDIFDKLVMHSRENTFFRFGFFVLFHVSFFICITTIGLNIIFGIIVDTFSELRDLKWTAERDMRDNCFICSRSSYDFEHHAHGFERHVNQEHDIWAYVFFFIHLHDSKASDYTAMELYVFKLLAKDKYDFFPLNRALSLAHADDDSTESKVDEVLKNVAILVRKQKEEDTRRQRDEEMLKQKRWREEHQGLLLADSKKPQLFPEDNQMSLEPQASILQVPPAVLSPTYAPGGDDLPPPPPFLDGELIDFGIRSRSRSRSLSRSMSVTSSKDVGIQTDGSSTIEIRGPQETDIEHESSGSTTPVVGSPEGSRRSETSADTEDTSPVESPKSTSV